MFFIIMLALNYRVYNRVTSSFVSGFLSGLELPKRTLIDKLVISHLITLYQYCEPHGSFLLFNTFANIMLTFSPFGTGLLGY